MSTLDKCKNCGARVTSGGLYCNNCEVGRVHWYENMLRQGKPREEIERIMHADENDGILHYKPRSI